MRGVQAVSEERLAGLLAFVSAACRDEDFRSRLNSRPADALRAIGFEHDRIPDRLAPPAGPISVTIDADTLFGLRDPIRPPRRTEEPLDTDLRLAMAFAKPLVLLHGPEDAMTRTLRFAQARGFFGFLGPHEFVPQVDPTIGGYSNTMQAVKSARAGSGHWRALAISADCSVAALAWLCLLFGWDRFLGNLLGYPDCCASAFEARWPRAHAEFDGDVGRLLLSDMGRRSIVPIGWQANVFARYFGFHLIEHFPCSLSCAATAALADRYLAALGTWWPDDAHLLAERLRDPILVLRDAGVCLLPDATVEGGDTVRVHVGRSPPLAAGVSTELTDALRTPVEIVSRTPGRWAIGRHEYDGWLLHPVDHQDTRPTAHASWR